MSRAIAASLATVAILVGVGVGVFAAVGASKPSASPSHDPGPAAAASTTPGATRSDAPTSGGPSASATVTPNPTPSATPVLVPAPLTGELVSPEVAARHPIAVMIDDHGGARPQSGFTSASVVWQAPAEGGIPRYMMIFQDKIPTDVGGVRSSRYYFITWAAEWRAVYVHSGGSPQALQTLRSKGNGQWVYNADEFRWGGFFRRVKQFSAPHNLYTTGKQLRTLATRLSAKDVATPPVWTFGPARAYGQRPEGGRIETAYSYNRIRYDYDRATNTYLRTVTGPGAQVDAANGQRVAPTNVVVMLMKFGSLGDDTSHHRLEAQVVGKGPAWIATNGTTIKGIWKKDSVTGPTRFFDAAGKPVTLTVGQTFVQVMQTGTTVKVTPGTPPTASAENPREGRFGAVAI
jgi:hypothetical protein